MNRQQKNYALAKAAFEACKDTIADYERKWIIEQDITNENGSRPTRIYSIENESVFDEMCEKIETEKEYQRLCADEIAAHDALIIAEDALIDYALSIVPASVKDTLNAHRKEWKVRDKILSAAFRLDTRTVK
jgi:hypothetical protein